MGVVYMAEQEKPVRRRVALKIIKPGMDTSQVIARFEAELQALALMDHQHIAKVLDAGATETGRPYFVMELVRGVPITEYCDRNQLTPKERLELFVPICNAIQHAHQNGIIHRDIKPSNVLVTLYDGKPVAKVIDFGVAKATDQRLTEWTMFTQFGQIVGTLEYMSPEQAEMGALDIDSRTDVYSLGVMLNELLTGSTPLQRAKLRQAYFEILRRIREDETPKPSTRLSDVMEPLATISAQRKMDPARLARLVRGELDWIVMRALEKDRVRRYDTANALARDIQRYLAGDPVEAGPPSAAYRLRKFARKHRAWMVTAAVFTAVLVLTTAVSVWQALRATWAGRRAQAATSAALDAERVAREERNRTLDAERVARAERNRAIDAETLAKEQTNRALRAEQKIRAELEETTRLVSRLGEATVLIKIKIGDTVLGSGTGFVSEVHGNTVLLVANRHVVVPDLSELSPGLLPKGKTALDVVFRSGLGLENEQTLPAEVLAAVLSDDRSTDLAFLAVKGVKRPPSPVNLVARIEPTEGMTFAAAGFPLGGTLAKLTGNKGNPSVTMAFGRIAALRRDDSGELRLLQVDRSLQPGNSGGPVVEDRRGILLGVALAAESSVDTIGFVIPADEVRRALAGRIGSLDLTLKSISRDSANLEIKAQIVDPKGAVQAVMIHAAPASAGTISPKGDGSWPPLPNTSAVELRRDPNAPNPTAAGQVQVAISGQGAAARKILIQPAHRDTRRTLVYSKPRVIDLSERPGRVMVSGETLRELKAFQRVSLSVLGALVDPEKDCKLTKDEDSMKITIDIPGGKIRSLDPTIVTRTDKTRSLHNAPMALIDVEGDFAASVAVTGHISPGTTLPKDRQGNDILFTFHGAGLLLYQDENRFVRLERTAGVVMASLQPIHKVLFEVVKDGKHVENQSYPPVREGPVSLLLMRRKGKMYWGYGLALGAPPIPLNVIELDLPKKVKIGLSASNISAKPLVAQFEEFALFTSETQIGAMFGSVAN
jgi:S1-C subfamily serine protease